MAANHYAKGSTKIIQASEYTRGHQETGQLRGGRYSSTQARRTGKPETRNTKILGTDRDAGRNIKGFRGTDRGYGGRSIELWKGEPTGSNRDACHIEGGKGGRTDGGRGGINGPAAQDFRGQEVHWVAS